MSYARSNQRAILAPIFRKLSQDQRREIHFASLEILERTGARLLLPEAVDLLRRAGADVTEGDRVRVPAGLVEWALAVAPKRAVLADRAGRRVMPLEGHNAFFGPGSDCLNIIDHRTGERREPTLGDVVEGVRVCDALPNIDFVMSMFLPKDVPVARADRYQMEAMLANTSKPVLFVTPDFVGCVEAIEMAEAVAGGAEALRRNPLCACYINVLSPLRHNEDSLRKLLLLAEKGIPTTYNPVVLRGSNGPITRAGALALANAGELLGLVLAQLKRQGAPVILSGGTQDMLDMRTLRDVYAAPENRVLCVEIAQFYGLPIFGLGGASDSKAPDEQAAAETAFSLLTEALAGSHLIHDVGYLEGGMTFSLEMLVMADEMIAWVKRFLEGIQIDQEHLALDQIDQVGPDGDFIGLDHTARHLREDWYPELFDRQEHSLWAQDGAKTLRRRARDRVKQILENHEPEPLPEAAAQALREITTRAASG
jgi:trimethylamine--corrinoid protein Co-methyltransferase